MNKLKKLCARKVAFFNLLGSSIQCLLFVGIRSYFTQHDVCKKMGQMHLSIVEEYFSVEVAHNLRIQFGLVWYLSIEQIDVPSLVYYIL